MARLVVNGLAGAAIVSTGFMFAPLPAEAVSFSTLDNPWQVRVRAIGVIPDEGSESDDIAGDVDIDDAYVPELDITYFFTKNIAAELILAVAPHDVSWNEPTLGNLDLGEVLLLPPTLTLQYHFNPEGRLRPYAGAGLNYTFFFTQDDGQFESIDYDDSFGYALQAGVDYEFRPNWLLNFDVKKVFLDTDVEIDTGPGGVIEADVDIDPWIVGIGVGYKY